jgi:predicted nucleotidyltransferase
VAPHRGPDRPLPQPLDRIVPAFVEDLRATLGPELVAVYVFGSIADDSFDPTLSDLDLMVVTASTVDRLPFEPFAGLIDRLSRREPDWADRLDIDFVGRDTLRTFREPGGPFMEISHEEPLALHRRAEDWLETWFLALDADWAIVGPPPTEVIAPISIDEFLDVLVDDAERYVSVVDLDWHDEKLAYRLLTVLRLRLSLELRRLCSKDEGASWASDRYPEWAALIRAAAEVRQTRGSRAFTPEERSQLEPALAALAADVVRRGAR